MQKLINYFEKTQLFFSTIFLVIFVLATLLQVVSRYIGVSVIWTEEIAVNSFIWSMFLGAAVMVRHKQHFSFNFLNTYLSSRKKVILVLIQNLILFIFCSFCLLYSIEITGTFWRSRWITLPFLQQGFVWLVLPITFFSITIYLVEDCINQVIIFRGEKE